jgi:hypothetical protein
MQVVASRWAGGDRIPMKSMMQLQINILTRFVK